jgi:hypothetical protein
MRLLTGFICIFVMYVPALTLWLVVGRYLGFDAGVGIGLSYCGYCAIGLWIAIERGIPNEQLPSWILLWPRLRKSSP